MEPNLIAAFLVGLFSAVHCVGMCGGIAGTLGYSLPQPVRGSTPQLSGYLLAFGLGRVVSYTAVGALLGSVGGGLGALLGPHQGHLFLQLVAAVLMVGIGLYIAGWFPQFALVERLGEPLWRRIEPLGRRLLPVRSLPAALLYGALWGWLPCGLVYTMGLWSLAADGPLAGMGVMAAFGAGTLPAVMAAGMLSVRLGRITRHGLVRKLAGTTLIVLAVAGLIWGERLHQTLPSPVLEQPMQCSL